MDESEFNDYKRFNQKILDRLARNQALLGWEKASDNFCLKNDLIMILNRYKAFIQRTIKEKIDFAFIDSHIKSNIKNIDGNDAALKDIVQLILYEEIKKEARRKYRKKFLINHTTHWDLEKRSASAKKNNKIIESHLADIDQFREYCLSLNVNQLEEILLDAKKYSENEISLIKFAIRQKNHDELSSP